MVGSTKCVTLTRFIFRNRQSGHCCSIPVSFSYQQSTVFYNHEHGLSVKLKEWFSFVHSTQIVKKVLMYQEHHTFDIVCSKSSVRATQALTRLITAFTKLSFPYSH